MTTARQVIRQDNSGGSGDDFVWQLAAGRVAKKPMQRLPAGRVAEISQNRTQMTKAPSDGCDDTIDGSLAPVGRHCQSGGTGDSGGGVIVKGSASGSDGGSLALRGGSVGLGR